MIVIDIPPLDAVFFLRMFWAVMCFVFGTLMLGAGTLGWAIGGMLLWAAAILLTLIAFGFIIFI